MNDFDPRTGELPPQSGPGKLIALAGIVLGVLYLLNPGAGVFEVIPDNLPLVGNLDEAAAAGMVVFGLRYLGIGFKRK